MLHYGSNAVGKRLHMLVRISALPLYRHHVGMDGWLALPRWGLLPHKKRQAALGALTLPERQ